MMNVDLLLKAQREATKQERLIRERIAAQGGAVPFPPKANKYGAIKATSPLFPGVTFDSKREMRTAEMLKARELAGEIRNLRLQVPFDLVVNGVKVCKYVADFTYDQPGGQVIRDPQFARVDFFDTVPGWTTVVADAKGKATREYKLKARLLYACHAIPVVEL